MHTQAYANRVNLELVDPNGKGWENRAHNMLGYLRQKTSTAAVDLWLAKNFPDGTETTWKAVSLAAETEYIKLTQPQPEETRAEHRLDVDCIRYAGAW